MEINASKIAIRTNLLRGTVKYRLRKLGYNTGEGVTYQERVIKEVLAYENHLPISRGIDHSLEYKIYFYWLTHKNNKAKDIADYLNITKGKVDYILNRIVKTGFVTVESKLNYLNENQL